MNYSTDSFSGPDGEHSEKISETNGEGTSFTNDGIVKTQKIDLNKLLLEKSKRRNTTSRLISRFISDPTEKKKWKKLFKRSKRARKRTGKRFSPVEKI